MPRLYGAPAYSRPPRHVDVLHPFDPDDLPLESQRGFGDRARLGEVAAIPVDDEIEETERTSILRRAVLPFGFRANRPTGTRR